MKFRSPATLIFALTMIFLFSNSVNSQGMYSSSSGGWGTGFGTVYGSHGYALATQDMYRVMQRQMNQNMIRDTAKSSTRAKNTKSNTVASAPTAPRNYGLFRSDATVDTAKALADTLGETPEEKAFIKKLFTATKTFYEKETAAKGWKNNIAGGLTFFTATAMTVYHDGDEPSAAAADTYYKAVNGALDEMPELVAVTNKDKQAFNNILIGFSGIMLASYSEAKENNDAIALAKSKKLAGMLIELILKTSPENIKIENNQIAVKL